MSDHDHDDDVDPTMDSDEIIDPSPSPLYSYIANEIFTDEDILADLEFDPRASNDLDDEIEPNLGQHELDSSMHSNSLIDIENDGIWNTEEKANQQFLDKKKRRLLCSCAMILKLIVLALGIGTLAHERNKHQSTKLTNALQNEISVPVTQDPTRSPTTAPTVEASPSCIDEVIVPKRCYTFREPIRLHFHYCNPESKNWLGLYREGSSDENGTMVQRSLYWQLSCGGHGESCKSPREYGSITMTPTLGIGRYQVYGMGNMERPYTSKAASDTFVVQMRCDAGDLWTEPSHL